MREWIENDAELAWLIDPRSRVAIVYRPDREPETLENPEQLRGEGAVEGFVLDMRRVWNRQ
jgi:hypothetical protein